MAVSNPRTLTGVHDAYQSRSDALWLTGLILLAFALRIPGLDASLWYDAAYTLAHYVRPPLAETLLTYEALNNHVFHTVLAKASVTIFGESAWALRLPAMLFGVASVWALWQLCREVVGPWETRLAALLMAVSYHHVWFSQNARGYTGLLFFGLLATWLLVCMVRRPTWRGWIAYGICLALAMYTHLSAAFFFLAHGVAFMLVYLWRAAVPVAGP